MWAALALLLLVVGCTVAERQPGLPAFEHGVKYVYKVQGRSLASVNEVGNQYVGKLIKSTAEIQQDRSNADQLNVKIENFQTATIHTWLHSGWESNPERINWEDEELEYPQFSVKFDHGKIKKIIVNRKTSTNETNLYRAIISPFILQTRRNSSGSSKVMEESILGEYETIYDVSVLPRYILQSNKQLAPTAQMDPHNKTQKFFQIYKTINYSKTSRHNIYHFGIASKGEEDNGDSTVGEAISRSASTVMLIEGSLLNYTLHSAVSTSQMTVSPLLYNNQKSKINSRMNVTLIRVTNGRVEMPSNSEERSIQFQMNPNAIQQSDEDDDDSSSSSGSSSDDNDSPQKPKNRNRRESFSPSSGNKYLSPNKQNKPIKNNNADSSDSSSSSDSDSSDSDSSDSNSSDSDSSDSDSSSSSSSEEEVPLRKPLLNNPSFDPTYPVISQQEQKQLVQNITYVAEKIGKQLENFEDVVEQKTLNHFVVLVRLVRNATYEQLAKVTENLYVSAGSNARWKRLAWKAFRDAVAQAGTGPALMAIDSWRSAHKLQPSEASNVMASLPQAAMLPSPQYLDYLFRKFVTEEIHQTQRPVYVTSLMTLTKLLHRTCVDDDFANTHYPVHTFKNPFQGCSKNVSNITDFLAKKLAMAAHQKNNKDILLYIRAIANVATKKAAEVFNPYLAGRQPNPPSQSTRLTIFQRLAIMIGLIKMAETEPDAARNIAFNVFLNEAEAYEVRVAAVYTIMNANPSAAVLQRMARATKTDSSLQVASVVKSVIMAAAALEDPDMQDLANNAQAAVSLLDAKSQSIHYSRYTHKDNFMKKFGNIGYHVDFAYIGSNDHIFPKAVFLHTNRYLGGMKLPPIMYTAMVSSINKLIDLYNGWDNLGYNQPEQPQLNSDGSVNMGPRANEPFEAQLQYPIPGGEKFITIGKQDLADLHISLVRGAVALRKGASLNYTKMYINHKMICAMPDVSGNLAYHNYKTVTLVQASVSAYASSEPDFTRPRSRGQSRPYQRGPFPPLIAHLGALEEVQVNAAVQLRYATMKSGHLGFINAYSPTNVRYTAAVEQQVMIHLPVKANLTYYQVKEEEEEEGAAYQGVNVTLSCLKGSKPVLARVVTEPFTTYQAVKSIVPAAESRNKKIIHVRKPQTVLRRYGPSGVFQFNVTTENDFVDSASAQHSLKDRDALSYLLFPWAVSDVQHGEFTLKANPSDLHQVKLTARYGVDAALDEEPLQHRARTQPRSAHSSSRSRGQGASRRATDAYSHLLDLSMSLKGSWGVHKFQTAVNFTGSEIRNVDNFAMIYNYSISPDIVRRPHLIQEMKLNAQGRWAYMPQFYFEDALHYNPDSNISFSLNYNSVNENRPPMNIKGKCYLERSNERLQHLKSSPSIQLCKQQARNGQLLLPACLNATRRVAVLDHTQCEAKYEHLAPWFLNATYYAYTQARQMLSPYASASVLHQGKPGTANLAVRFTPNLHGVSVYMSSPSFAARFSNVSLTPRQSQILPPQPSYALPTRALYTLLRGQNQPMCQLDRNYINTYDNKTYPLEGPGFGQCWHVMMTRNAYSVPRDSNVTVLVRDEGHQMRSARVIVGDNIDIILTNPKKSLNKNDYSIVVNQSIGINIQDGQYLHQQVETDDASTDVIQTTNNVIQVLVREQEISVVYLAKQGVTIYFDGDRLIVSAPNKFRNDVHGLCGTFTGAPVTDFTDQENLVQSQPKYFVASQIWNPRECSGQAVDNYHHSKKVPRFSKDILLFPPYHPLSASRSNNPWGDESNTSSDSSSSDSSSSSSSSSEQGDDSNSSRNSTSSSDSSSSSSSSDSSDNSNDSSSSSSDSSSEENQPKQKGSTNNPEGQRWSDSRCSDERTKLIVRQNGHLYCFSKHTLRECYSPCTPVSTAALKVPFHCIANSAAARYFREKQQRGENLDFSQKSTTHVLEVHVPQACE